MSRNGAHWGRLITAVAAYLATTPVLAAAHLLNATLEPAEITVGQSAQLTISRLGTGIEGVTLPVVAGLEFRVIEEFRQSESIHGASLPTTTTVVRVTPQTVGTFIIPGITPKSQPLVLRVVADGAAGTAHSPTNAAGGVGTPPSEGIRMMADGSAYARLSMPKGEAYVGESIPIAIEVGVRAGVVTSVNGLPTVNGGDFTLNNLSRQPERSERTIDGKPFTVLTWRSVLAAVKPGKFPLSVEAPVTVRIPTRSQSESKLEDALGDPFLQRVFGTTVPKEITVASPTYELAVEALPTVGRPPDFSGAVGTFTISSDISSGAAASGAAASGSAASGASTPRAAASGSAASGASTPRAAASGTAAPGAPTAAAGDPLTLRMRVQGAGNFDRVDSGMLDHVDSWKTYPPKSSFHASDAIGYKGEKIFEQPVIALRPGPQTLPGLAFSYFDPATGRYETARSPPLSVMISPSSAEGALPSPQGSVGSTGLRPDHAATGALADSLVPLYLRPRFLAIPSCLGLAFAGAWLVSRREKFELRLPARVRPARVGQLSKAARRVLAQLDSAARAGDAAVFLNCARQALLDTLPQPVASAPRDASRDGDSDDIRQLFALADEVSYSGSKPQAIDFARWLELVRRRYERTS
jgi:hypothetical protein